MPGKLPRCPVHAVAYVERSELRRAGGDPLLGRCIAGRFTVLGKLGSGSMGAVYRARQEAVGRDVALKIVRPDRTADVQSQARFEREAQATSALASPHTVTVFDFGAAEDGSWFLAMELLRGETLGARLRAVGRLAPRAAIGFACEALESLAEAHAKGIIHRDLKPDNLFLEAAPGPVGRPAQEVCKLLDFGIAKLIHNPPALDQLETQAGAVFGTPRYMSPEQAQGEALDARSDLYSLSVILYAMLTGGAPFVDDDAVVVMASHITRKPPAFAQVAPSLSSMPALEAVVMRGLAKAPSERPQSAEIYAGELKAALASDEAHPGARPAHPRPTGGASLATDGGPGVQPRGRLFGRPWAWALAALALGSLVAGGGSWLASKRPVRSLSRFAPSGMGRVASAVGALVRAEAAAVATSKERATPAPAASRAPKNSSGVVEPRQRPQDPLLHRGPGDRYGRFE